MIARVCSLGLVALLAAVPKPAHAVDLESQVDTGVAQLSVTLMADALDSLTLRLRGRGGAELFADTSGVIDFGDYDTVNGTGSLPAGTDVAIHDNDSVTLLAEMEVEVLTTGTTVSSPTVNVSAVVTGPAEAYFSCTATGRDAWGHLGAFTNAGQVADATPKACGSWNTGTNPTLAADLAMRIPPGTAGPYTVIYTIELAGGL